MKILFCKWNGCAELGLENALTRLGHQVDTVFYAFPGADYSQECLALLRDRFNAESYDMVFSHNFIPIVSKVCQIYKIIYVSWMMDSPAHHLYSNAVENSCNRVFIFDQQLFGRFARRNPGHIFYYPLATCLPEWKQALASPPPKRDFCADISFLGSLYIDECHYDQVEGVPSYLKGYLDGLIEAQLNVYGYNFLEDVLPRETAEEYARYARWMQTEDYIQDVQGIVAGEYLSKKCSQLERIRISEALADSGYDYKLYTNSPVPENIKRCFRGVAGYYDEMPWVFHESRINLNITAKGIQSGLPLRLFDIMGCGGFVLTNYQPELLEYFEPGKDLAVYESIPHLLEQTEYYLSHEEERMEIAGNGYEKVKNCFTYDIALAEILRLAFA